MKRLLYIILFLILGLKSKSQILAYTFIDPCTKQVSVFTVPATGTVIVFLNKSRSFTANDVADGTLAAWINQVYADYRKVSPCSVQSGQVTQNQITSQVVSGAVQSVVGSVMSSAQSSAVSSTTSSVVSSSASVSTSAGASTSTTSSSSSQSQSSESKQEEVASSTTESTDGNKEGGESSSSGGGGGKSKSGGAKASNSNPMIVSSDFTTAQNLDGSFTPILNLGMSQSSMTGASSWGLTGMIWMNFKQFALSGRYTKMIFNKKGALKYISNLSLTGVYSYGNLIGFGGYSGIINLDKYGVTGFNISAAFTKVSDSKGMFLSPSFTAFYTKPFPYGKKLIISPELYIMSTPLIYSSSEKIATTDRNFGAFVGAGFDYKITKRFKFNFNYKANLSTNPEIPVLSFFLIGSKVNL